MYMVLRTGNVLLSSQCLEDDYTHIYTRYILLSTYNGCKKNQNSLTQANQGRCMRRSEAASAAVCGIAIHAITPAAPPANIMTLPRASAYQPLPATEAAVRNASTSTRHANAARLCQTATDDVLPSVRFHSCAGAALATQDLSWRSYLHQA